MEIHEHASASAASMHFDTPSGQDLKRSGDVTRFTEVDLTADARFFVDFMDHANAQPDRQRFRKIIAERLNISAGDRVLDVGCGTGDDVRMLASLVGPTGRVIGIDASKSMIDVAHQRSRSSALPVSFAVGNAFSLDFLDDAFDACRCETVLMHVDGEPSDAIAEMVRVTRPGGRVVVFDVHWDAVVIDHPDRSLTREIVHVACDAVRHGWIGGQLPRFMDNAGLTDIQVEGSQCG